MRNTNIQEIIDGILAGQERFLARGLTMAENQEEGFVQLVQGLIPRSEPGHILGITGPPGAGKSTLTSALVKEYLEKGLKVGVIAVDPSSPFSGGAILGDRVRMMDLAGLDHVFIRSMASRGALGGLSPAVFDGIHLMEAYGCEQIIIETVGVGQSEIDIVGVADTVLVVFMPGVGDDIQALKAGLMEVGDVFVINKADQEGADRLMALLGNMLDIRSGKDAWKPPVLKAIATRTEGIQELYRSLQDHAMYLKESGEGEKKRRQRARQSLLAHLDYVIKDQLIHPIVESQGWEDAVDAVERRQASPGDLSLQLLRQQGFTEGGFHHED